MDLVFSIGQLAVQIAAATLALQVFCKLVGEIIDGICGVVIHTLYVVNPIPFDERPVHQFWTSVESMSRSAANVTALLLEQPRFVLRRETGNDLIPSRFIFFTPRRSRSTGVLKYGGNVIILHVLGDIRIILFWIGGEVVAIVV